MTTPTPTPLILVVDDDPSTCALTATLLEREGFATVRATSGAEALDIVRSQPITLLLLDVMMPGLSGFDVCAKLREFGIAVPVILLTARDDLDTRVEGMHHGVSEFLTKPINRNELYARVRAQLHIVDLAQQLETIERNVRSADEPPAPAKAPR